jgi:hypothetical protein
MKARNVPHRLWDFCSKWSCDICSKSASDHTYLNGRTPYEAVTGHTPDILSVADFDFYEPVWYFDEKASFPEPKQKMARWLGEAYNIGQAMCYFILPQNGIPIAQSTVQPISEELRSTFEVQKELKRLDEGIIKKRGELISNDSDIPDYFYREDNNEDNPETPHFGPSQRANARS